VSATVADRPATSARPVTTARDATRRARLPVLLALLIVGTGIVLALLGTAPGGSLDPASPAKGGSAALAHLLADRGVSVERVDAVPAAAAADTTVFVPDLDRLGDGALDPLLALARAADVVVAGGPDLGTSLGTDLGTDDVAVRTRDPECTLPAAVTAGPAQTGGTTFARDARELAELRIVAACYPAHGDPTLLVLRGPGGGSLTLLGSAAFVRNDRLAHEGDAALALGLLDAHPTVTWVLPRPGQGVGAEGKQQSLTELLPRGVLFGAGELLVVVVLLAAWRGRRLGPVVREPLPVIVRAAETAHGRARLYRSANARDRAAEALRQAVRARLAATLGLPAATTPPTLVAAVAEHTDRSPGAVATLLYGDDRIPDDAGLVRLTDDLDQLEREVRL
jgi:hypothetical protein